MGISRNALLIWGIVALAMMCIGCGGGSGGGGGTLAADTAAPYFTGLRCIATAGGAAVRLEWGAADDANSSAFTYDVYAGAATGAQPFATSIASTSATSIVVTSADSALIALGTRVFFVVRATDGAGNQDENTVELACTPQAAGTVAFVSDTAGGPGTLGDPTDPFVGIQAGIDAVEAGGGGLVLVDAAPGGTVYANELGLLTPVTHIALYGGFARFSALPAGATGAQILATRDVAGRETGISGSNAILADGDLIHMLNMLSTTDIDGFTLRDLFAGQTALTGTLEFTRGSHLVTGTGTLFSGEVIAANVLIESGSGIAMDVDVVRNDRALVLETPWTGATGTGPGAIQAAANQKALIAIDAVLQVSCCRFVSAALLDLDTSVNTMGSSLRLVGNWIQDHGEGTAQVDGGCAHLRVQNNDVRFRDGPMVVGTVYVQAGGTFPVIASHNRLSDANGIFDLDFAAAVPATGGALNILCEHNEVSGGDDAVFDLDDAAEVGANGSLTAIFRHNVLNGPGGEHLIMDTVDTGVGPYAGVTADIQVYDNVLLSADDESIELDLGPSAGQPANLVVRDNHFGPMEDALLYITDAFSATMDAHDGGTMSISFLRNVATGGSSSMIDGTVGAAHGGRTHWLVAENTLRHPDDYGLDIDLDPNQGTTSSVYAVPTSTHTLAVFNNDIQAGADSEGVYLNDRRTDGSYAFVWLGHNFAQASGDASDGAFYFDLNSSEGHYLFERNVGLGSGQDDNEVGFHLETVPNELPNAVVYRNNIATGGFGGGFQQDIPGPWAQWINNTAAYSGSAEDQHGAFSMDQGFRERGDAQMFMLGCIASHSGGQDVDYRDGMISAWSLVRDALNPHGYMNLSGEPYYARTFTDIPHGFSPFDFGTLFTLDSASPAIDAGHPAARYDDPDGTRNDMGAYGGPGAGPVGILPAGSAMPLAFVGMAPSADLFAGAELEDATATLMFGFNQPVDAASLPGNLTIRNGGVSVPGVFSTVAAGYVVQFVPTTVLNPTSGQIVEVSVGTGLLAMSGAVPAYPQSFRFGVAGTPTVEVEPNDDGVAGLLPADTVAAQALGIGAGPTVFEVTGTMAAVDDFDVYAVSLTAGHRLMATVLQNRLLGGTTAQLDLSIHDATGRTIRMGRRRCFDGGAGSGDPYLDWIVESTGTYYIVVTQGAFAATPAYQLQGVVDPLD